MFKSVLGHRFLTWGPQTPLRQIFWTCVKTNKYLFFINLEFKFSISFIMNATK